MAEIGVWMKKYPNMFLDDSYLKYVGWTLYDKVSGAGWWRPCLSDSLLFFLILAPYLSIVGNSGHLTRLRLQRPQEQCYPFLTVCAVFSFTKQRCGCQCFRSLTCTKMLMHAIAHKGCTDIVGESGLKVDSGIKIPCGTREWNQPQQHAGPTLYQLSYIPDKMEAFSGLSVKCYAQTCVLDALSWHLTLQA